MNEETINKLNDLWNDPETGLTSLSQFHKTIKQHGLSLTMKQLQGWYNGKETNQVTKKVKRDVKAFIPIQCPENVECLQMDLMDISKYSAQNSNFKYLFNVLHLNSRYVWSFPIKSKSPTAIVSHLENVVDAVRKRTDENEITVTSDDGSEFKASVAALLKKLNIRHYTSVDTYNTANIERFHRTLWGYINKYATAKKTLKFIDVLPQLISKYNQAQNRSIKNSPEKLWNADRVELPRRKVPKTTLRVGDRVRFLVKQETFEKRSFKNQFSEQIFTIESLDGNRFVLSNGDKYLARELQLVPEQLSVVSERPQVQEPLEEQIKKVTKTNKTVRRNREFAGDEVQSIGEQVVFKPRLQPAQTKRQRKMREILDL